MRKGAQIEEISDWGLGFSANKFSSSMDPSNFNSVELQRLLEEEKKKAMLNEMVAKITKVCWDKCITGTPGSKLSSSETTCLSNCSHRYMDLSLTIMKRFQSMQ